MRYLLWENIFAVVTKKAMATLCKRESFDPFVFIEECDIQSDLDYQEYSIIRTFFLVLFFHEY